MEVKTIWEYGIVIALLAVFFIPTMIWLIKRSLNAALDTTTLKQDLAVHRTQILERLETIETYVKNREETCGKDHTALVDAVHGNTTTLKESIALQTFIIEHYIKLNGEQK